MFVLILILNLTAILFDNVIVICVIITVVTIAYAFYARHVESVIEIMLKLEREDTSESKRKVESLFHDNNVYLGDNDEIIVESKCDDEYNTSSKGHISDTTNYTEYNELTRLLTYQYNQHCDSGFRCTFLEFVTHMASNERYAYRKQCVDWLSMKDRL